MIITSSCNHHARQVWAERVHAAITAHDPIAGQQVAAALEQYRSNRFVLTILGKAKRGKSTLINALLNRRDDLLAPIDKLPASNAITRFIWSGATVGDRLFALFKAQLSR